MTVWVLHQELSAEDEAHILGRTELLLPFSGLPDLSGIHSLKDCKSLMAALHPEDAPESITHKAETVWRLFSEIQLDDIIAVPLPATRKVAIAKVSGPYRYRVGEQGADIHAIGVSWYQKIVDLRRFGKHRELFAPGGEPMLEVTNKDARTAIRDKLPHSYNRFVHVKWIIALLIAMRITHYLMVLITKKSGY